MPTTKDCAHRSVGNVRWDVKPGTVIVDCAECGVEAVVPLEWYDAEWGDD